MKVNAILAMVFLLLGPMGYGSAAVNLPRSQVVPRIVAPIDETDRVELPGHVNRAARGGTDLGPADPRQTAERVIMTLGASVGQQADLDRFVKAQHIRGVAEYHAWLTPSEFAARYGAAPADIQAISHWLAAHGFRVDEVPAGGRSIIVSGTLGQIEAAFRVKFHRYRWHGELHLAAANNPSIPKAFAGVILGFASLSDFRLRATFVRSVRPQYTNGSAHYLAPSDFATIYDLNSSYAQGVTGAGRSIAVLGRSDVAASDLSIFRSAFGLSSNLPEVIVNGPDPGLVAGDETESDLDLEWAGAVAPAASLTFVTSKSTSLSDGVTLSAQYAVSNNLADIITVSYSGCESSSDVSAGTTFFNALWQQAAAQGTSVFVSSGDSGAAGCDAATEASATQGLGVSQLCSSPFDTCVGGTEFMADVANPGAYWSSTNSSGTQGSALGYIAEAVWNQSGSNLYASGGGASIYFAKPQWQLSPGVPLDARRDVPDVALSASVAHDPYMIVTSDGYPSGTVLLIGGTSAATPSMAGIAALVAQKQNGRVGNFNPVLYGLSSLQAGGGAPVFHRVTSGNNSVPGQTGFSASTSDPSYNQATGLGSIDGGLLVAHWNDYEASGGVLVPSTAYLPSAVSLGTVALKVPAATTWSAVVGGGGSGWLTVTPRSGQGPAQLTFSATVNPAASSRAGTILVAGAVLTVTQAAAAGSGAGSANISLSATSLSLGSAAIGNATAGQQLLIADTGNANLTIGSIGLNGTAANEFSESGSCASGVVLIPGAVCYLDVSFLPDVIGAQSANLQIDVNGTVAASASLAGTGTTAPTPVDSDGPLPNWAYGVLALSLYGISARRRLTASRLRSGGNA